LNHFVPGGWRAVGPEGIGQPLRTQHHAGCHGQGRQDDSVAACQCDRHSVDREGAKHGDAHFLSVGVVSRHVKPRVTGMTPEPNRANTIGGENGVNRSVQGKELAMSTSRNSIAAVGVLALMSVSGATAAMATPTPASPASDYCSVSDRARLPASADSAAQWLAACRFSDNTVDQPRQPYYCTHAHLPYIPHTADAVAEWLSACDFVRY
jgi:hypothetical protein